MARRGGAGTTRFVSALGEVSAGRGGVGRGATAARRGSMRRRSFAGEPAARLFLGFALEIRFARETRLFFVLAGVGGGALLPLAGFALGSGLGLDFGAAAIFLLASAGVDQRAGAGFALVIGEGAQHHARRATLRARLVLGGRRRGVGGAAAGAGAATGAWGFVSTFPRACRLTVSTTTVLVRPWEKRWLTMPVSDGRCLRCSVFDGVTVKVLSPLFSVSLIHCPISGPRDPFPSNFLTHPRFRSAPPGFQRLRAPTNPL